MVVSTICRMLSESYTGLSEKVPFHAIKSPGVATEGMVHFTQHVCRDILDHDTAGRKGIQKKSGDPSRTSAKVQDQRFTGKGRTEQLQEQIMHICIVREPVPDLPAI